MAIPKKHIHGAVDRNRLKRVIREGFRARQQALNGKDVVVVVRSRTEIKKSDFETRLIKLWGKIIK